MSFAEAGKKIEEGVASGLYTAGSTLMAMSQQIVPVETGTLKRSGRVDEPVVDADSVSVTVGYGYGSQYAAKAQGDGDELTGPGYGVYVHEILTNKHKPPTQAKFLETPAAAIAPALGEFIQEGVRARLERA